MTKVAKTKLMGKNVYQGIGVAGQEERKELLPGESAHSANSTEELEAGASLWPFQPFGVTLSLFPAFPG